MTKPRLTARRFVKLSIATAKALARMEALKSAAALEAEEEETRLREMVIIRERIERQARDRRRKGWL